MKFKYTKKWNEILQQLDEVKTKCNNIIKRLERKGISMSDPRREGMIHVRQCCNTIAFVPIRLLKQIECGRKNEVMEILELNDSDLKSCLGDLKKNAKISFITIVQFALENCIGRIIEDKTGKKPPSKFKDKCKKIIELSGISDRRKVKFNRLMLLAYIRNTLHSGGIHRWGSLKRKIKGVSYTLKKGKTVDCASWGHIFFLLWHSLDLYEWIFLRL